jgi:hypothetical protein
MQLKQIFTERDDTIEANAFRDPMGLQIIWSAVGQNIFGRNITSISNDMRNFNINLFNHWIVKDLTIGEHPIQLSSVQKEYYSGVNLKTGLIIFLENLLTYLMLNEAELDRKVPEESVDLSGLLGTMKARNRLGSEGLSTVSVSVDQEDTILVRQISLGINGRYRTPFIEARLIDSSYNYEPYEDAWKNVSDLFASQEFFNLVACLKTTIRELFANQANQAPPNTLIKEIRNLEKLQIGFVRCFGTRENTRSIEFQNFWRERLKLNAGVSGVLYDCAKNRIHNEKVFIQDVVHDAIENTPEDFPDKENIDDIRKLEPFLVSMNSLFKLICSKEIESIDHLREALHEKKVNGFMDMLKAQALEAQKVEPNISGASRDRLQGLTSCNFDSLSDCVEGLQKYHGDVMEQRGNNAWFTYDGTQIKHNVREYEKRFVDFGKHWENGYYIDSMISLCRGLEGVEVEIAQ